ncbi:MAG TPA: MBL fold metallo-hydrolase [Vicinamibacteria bacterium]|nr:MBL fold metallo-hydrolase [Vicinamibacteria bacterium]
MDVTNVEADILRVRGQAYDSAATVYLSGENALLVDALGSRSDAEDLRRLVTRDLGARVRFVIATHYFSDHMAALASFPEAQIVAHRDHRYTFDSERNRSEEERGFYLPPSIEVGSELLLRWGRFTFDVFHNPGHTTSTLNVDVSEADAVHVGDNLVGNIVYLAYSSPALLRRALGAVLRRGRARVMASHGPVAGARAVENALEYLQRLETKVRQAWWTSSAAKAIGGIGLGDCLAPGVTPTDFEAAFHDRNLASIIERRLFERN